MKKLILLGIVGILMVGCTYPLKIVNEENFKSSSIKPENSVKIGFLHTEDRLLNSAIKEISVNTMVEVAKKDYQIGSEVKVDYVSELSNDMKFRADGANFFITFPGFIVFSHAWAGYKYYVDIDTHTKLLEPGGKVLNEASISTPYEIRYTSFARGTASSLVGWLTPGWGLLNVIPGAIFASSYDERATPEFIEKVMPSYSAFISSKVLEQIAKEQQGTSSSTQKYHYKMEPVVIGDALPDNIVNNPNDDRHFATYVMRMEDGHLIQHTNTIRELPEETWQMLDKIARKELTPDADQIQHILFALGISEIPFPEDMGSVSIYTMQDDRMVTLFKGNKADLNIARR